MKILFVFGGKQRGGAERVITNLSNEMTKKNEVCFLGLKKMESFYDINKNIKYYYIENNVNNDNFFKRNFSRIISMKKKLREINPDIIISFAREQSYRLLLLNLFNKKKIIISVRNDPMHEYVSIFEKIVMNILYSRVNGFVFQTADAQKFFRKSFQKKSVIIPNPINETFICKPFKGKRENIIVTAGRLTEQKNQKLLIEAYSKLPHDLQTNHLYIFGSGELKDSLESLIKKLNLQDKVHLAGAVDNIKEKIYSAKLFVLSSAYEGMPNALMEAMSLGLPCISTDCPCGGPRFLIKNKYNGILVKNFDVDELSNAMAYLLTNEEEAKNMGLNANKINKSLNPNVINKMWIDFINQIMGRR